MTGGNLKESEVEAQEASGKGREWRWEQPGGPLIHCLLAGLGRAALVMGKARWVLSSQLEQSDSGLCEATITPTRKIGPVGFICVCWDSQEAENMWVS